MKIYLFRNGQQTGPYSIGDIQGMVTGNLISGDDLAWHEDLTEWQPLKTVIPLLPPPDAPAIPVNIQPEQEVVQTNVEQGALEGGLLCFIVGLGLMMYSMWSFFFYGPLFLVAFILSIVAMSQRRVFGGIVLLLATFVVPAVFGLLNFRNELTHLWP